MKEYRADLHIHTVLSPCGSLDMSPALIVKKAAEKKLDIIGITDHNSTLHCKLVEQLAQEAGIFVLKGAEVTTSEEIHCLAFFEKTEELDTFQRFMEERLPDIRNNTDLFGYQVTVDEDEKITGEVEKLLITGLHAGIDEVAGKVRSLNGIFIPAHVNREKFGIIHQIGFIPEDLDYDGLELSRHISVKNFTRLHPELTTKTFIRSSDAHFPDEIGTTCTYFRLKEKSFEEIRLALHKMNERGIIIYE